MHPRPARGTDRPTAAYCGVNDSIGTSLAAGACPAAESTAGTTQRMEPQTPVAMAGCSTKRCDGQHSALPPACTSAKPGLTRPRRRPWPGWKLVGQMPEMDYKILSAVLQSLLTVPLEALERGYLPEMANIIAQFATEREKAEHEQGARDRDMSPIHHNTSSMPLEREEPRTIGRGESSPRGEARGVCPTRRDAWQTPATTCGTRPPDRLGASCGHHHVMLESRYSKKGWGSMMRSTPVPVLPFPLPPARPLWTIDLTPRGG